MEQTVIARNASAEARAKHEQVLRLKKQGDSGGNIADVLQSHTVRLLKEQLGKATRREAELATRYGPRHPEMLKIRAEVADAEAQLNAEIEQLVSNLKNVMEEAAHKERELAVNLGSLKQQQVLSKEAGVMLKELERDAATTKQLFESLMVRYKQTAETQSLQLPDSRIIERADIPLFPAAPKRTQIVLLATAGGLLAGIMLVLALEFATRGVARPEDIEPALSLPHLTSLPRISDDTGKPIDAAQEVRFVVTEPYGVFADQIRSLRREIDLRRGTATSRLVLIPSSLPGEGSMNVASNLAHHYALTGNKVLLIDGDIRRAELTRQLVPDRLVGLAERLQSGAPLESAILKDQRTGLHLLPAKGPTQIQLSGAELLSSPSVRPALASLRSQFDTIIVVAPPLLPVLDGRIWADYADQIAFVIAWRRTPKQLAKKALKTLGDNQAKILGVVLSETEQHAIAEPDWDTKTSNFRPLVDGFFGMLRSR
jgi:capsular exopolysaccharide synthesis family protein